MSDFISSPSGIRRLAITALSGLMVLGIGISFQVQCGSNSNVHCQEWKTSDGRSVGYLTSSGNLVLSGSTIEQGIAGGGSALTQGAADARYVNTSGDTMTGQLVVRANMSGATLNVGNSGSTLRLVRTNTATIDFANLAVASCETSNIT